MAREAYALQTLTKEVNGIWPTRDRTSDGGIGDTAHASRSSKHNPGPDGIWEAHDYDEDISGKDGQGGKPLWPFVVHLLRLAKVKKHPALNGRGAHIIYEGRIWSFAHRWVERPYTGLNAHKHHAHVAVVDGPGKDSKAPWGIKDLLASPPATPKPDRWLGVTNPPMRGQDVINVKNYLRSLGNKLADTDVYDMETAQVVKVYQDHRGIVERGVGPQTWDYMHRRK